MTLIIIYSKLIDQYSLERSFSKTCKHQFVCKHIEWGESLLDIVIIEAKILSHPEYIICVSRLSLSQAIIVDKGSIQAVVY